MPAQVSATQADETSSHRLPVSEEGPADSLNFPIWPPRPPRTEEAQHFNLAQIAHVSDIADVGILPVCQSHQSSFKPADYPLPALQSPAEALTFRHEREQEDNRHTSLSVKTVVVDADLVRLEDLGAKSLRQL